MPLSRRELSSLAAIFLGFVVAGCTPAQSTKETSEPTGRPNPITRNFEGADLYANIPSDLMTIKDEEVDFNERSGDPQLVAKWATERKKVIGWCLKEKVIELNEFNQEQVSYKRVWPRPDMRPQTRIDQAIAIGSKVIELVPSDSWERFRLAESLFFKGSAMYWGIDACMNKIGVLRGQMELPLTGPESEEKNPKYPDQSHEIETLRQTARNLYDDMRVYHSTAFKHFSTYAKDRPMDKTGLDFMWKIQYQLGNFREAVRLMNELLDSDLITEDNVQRYQEIRKAVNDYLVEREINAAAPKPDERIKGFKVDSGAPK
jgi:hypothetical protein